MNKLLAIGAVGAVAMTTAAVGPGPLPVPVVDEDVADFFIEVDNKSPFRVEIRVSHSPNQSRRAGRVPANATRRLKGNWREGRFVLIITALGAGALDNARGGAQEDDAILYTDYMTVEENGQVELEIPVRLPGPNLRTSRP